MEARAASGAAGDAPGFSRRTVARYAAGVLSVLSAACSPGGGRSGFTPGEGVQARPTALRPGAKVVLLNEANAAGAELVEQVLARWHQSQPGASSTTARPRRSSSSGRRGMIHCASISKPNPGVSEGTTKPSFGTGMPARSWRPPGVCRPGRTGETRRWASLAWRTRDIDTLRSITL